MVYDKYDLVQKSKVGVVGGGDRRRVANVQYCDIIVSEFELQSSF